MRLREDGAGAIMCHARRCRTQARGRIGRPSSGARDRELDCQRSRGATRANAIDGCHIDRGSGRGEYAITQHEAGRMRRDPPGENDVRNAIECATVSATRIEIVLNESIVAGGRIVP